MKKQFEGNRSGGEGLKEGRKVSQGQSGDIEKQSCGEKRIKR